MAILTEPRGWICALPDLDIHVDGPKRDDIIKALFDLIQIRLVATVIGVHDSTMDTYCVPSVNNLGGFCCAFAKFGDVLQIRRGRFFSLLL